MKTRILAALAVAIASACVAAPAIAATPDTFTATAGSWFTGSNWSQGVKPSRTVEAVIPPGHEAQLPKNAESGDLLVEGSLVGPQSITVYGSVKVAHGGIMDLDQGFTVTGLGTIDLGGTEPYYLRLKGWHRLESDVTVHEDLELEVGATLNTQGHAVTVPRETYSFLKSTLYMGKSTWRTGEWFIYGPELQELRAEEATLIVDRPVLGETFGYSSFACGCGWTYGNMTVEGYEPLVWRDFNVTGTFTLNRSVGGVRLEHGSTIGVGQIASDGTPADPARVESDQAGQPYTVRIPHDETIEGCLAVSDMHVEGGVLTDPCEGDHGGNSGVAF